MNTRPAQLKLLMCLGLLAAFGCAEEDTTTTAADNPPAAAAPAADEPAQDEEHHYITVTTKNFEEVVLNADKPVLIDFWAEWCGPCRMIAPSVEEIAKEYEGRAVVAKIDVDEAPELAAKYNIGTIPNLLYMLKGEQVDQIEGAAPKEDIEQKLAALISDPAAD